MKKWQLFGTTAIGASLLLGACGGGNSDSGKGSGEVKGDGSSTVGPIIEKLNEKFIKEYFKRLVKILLYNINSKRINAEYISFFKKYF